jgi:hypothetical protein
MSSTSEGTAVDINTEPTLVWIDDNPINNAGEVAEARSQGINVVEIPSTAIAKLWIEENSGKSPLFPAFLFAYFGVPIRIA